MECTDGLLWIGQTYRQIWCGKDENCAPGALRDDGARIPYQKGTHCFVHEAERRGISRKVPGLPTWLVEGKSRIFLAHRGDLDDPGRGRLFGYFVLERAEVLDDPVGYVPPATRMTARHSKEKREPDEGIASGVVRDAWTSRAVKGVVVEARGTLLVQGKKKTIRKTMTTDDQGRYELILEDGEYRLGVTHSGYLPSSVPGVIVATGRRTVQDLYLDPIGIVGTVRDATTSVTVAGALVEAFDDGTPMGSGRTDRRGRYCLILPAGAYRVEASHRGYVTRSVRGVRVVATAKTAKDIYLVPLVTPSASPAPSAPAAVSAVSAVSAVASSAQQKTPSGGKRSGKAKSVPTKTTVTTPTSARPRRGPRPGGGRITPKLVRTILEMFYEDRDCSLRVRPGGIYVTDALGAKVSDEAAEGMKRSRLYSTYRKAANERERREVRVRGRRKFNEIVDQVHEPAYESKTTLPADLKGSVRGELVLFDHKPVLKHYPVATFRGIAHVDGSQLIGAVQKRRLSVKLPVCVHRHPELPLTKAELCGKLAAELGPSAAEVERLLAKLAEIARADLANDGLGMFRLGRIGRIGDASRKSRHARNRGSLVELLTATLVELEDVTDEMSDEDRLAVEARNKNELATRRAEAAAFCRVLFRLAAKELGKKDVAEFRLPGVGTIKAEKPGRFSFRPDGALQAPAARLV